ncbi:MAG: RNA polymerase sigma factor [Myxococcales bacterium]|jgi:RNA polymerase sigma factor (sigma-70 family)
MFFDGKPELLRTFRKGDRQVLRDVYVAYGEVVYRYCRDRLHSASDARDLVQEVFLTAFKEETRLRFSGISSFQGFVLGIAKNLLLHRFRSDRVRQAGNERIASDQPAEPSEPPEVDRKLEEEAARKVLEGFLAELNERERSFFEAHMMTRPARRVTAERFGMSEDQVRYLEKKLREKAISYLKRVGYLEVAGAELRLP